MNIVKVIFLLFFFISKLHAASLKNIILKKEKITYYTPHLINPKYFAFEFGFITKKIIRPWKYNYNAFVRAFMAEESYTTNSNLRAAAIGGKAGFLLPTQPWIPLYLEYNVGFARTALHKHPWFGKEEQTESSKYLILTELGIVMKFKNKILIKVHYQLNNVSYFKKKLFLSIGANF